MPCGSSYSNYSLTSQFLCVKGFGNICFERNLRAVLLVSGRTVLFLLFSVLSVFCALTGGYKIQPKYRFSAQPIGIPEFYFASAIFLAAKHFPQAISYSITDCNQCRCSLACAVLFCRFIADGSAIRQPISLPSL